MRLLISCIKADEKGQNNQLQEIHSTSQYEARYDSCFRFHDLGDLRYAVGPGLRYNTPVGPVRLDVGVIVDRRPGEGFGRIEFSIGQAF